MRTPKFLLCIEETMDTVQGAHKNWPLRVGVGQGAGSWVGEESPRDLGTDEIL